MFGMDITAPSRSTRELLNIFTLTYLESKGCCGNFEEDKNMYKTPSSALNLGHSLRILQAFLSVKHRQQPDNKEFFY